MNNRSQPLSADEVHLLKDVFKAVHRNFLRYISMDIFLFIVLGFHIAFGLSLYQREGKVSFIVSVIAGIIVWLITLVHRYVAMYYTHQKALLHDIRANVKYVCSGRLLANGIEENRLVYEVDGQTIKVADKYTLLGWKVKRFDALMDTEITVNYLPQSLLLLGIQYPETASEATSEAVPLNEEQIKVLAVLSKKDRPTRQIVHQGIVTERLLFVFSIFYFRSNRIPDRFTFRHLNIRLGNHLLIDVSDELQVGQWHKVVEFL